MVTDYMEMLEKRNEELEREKAALLDELMGPQVQILLCHPKAHVPTRKRTTDAGFDLYCVERVDIEPGDQAVLPTGVQMAISPGWYGRVAPRSGLAVNHVIDVNAGVIDAAYRGEIKVALINLGKHKVEFKPGERIAQIIFERYSMNELTVVDYLTDTDRGGFGFGSSGR
ncbi:dUTP diphosphatase [Phytohalomonas tamaricis]|uniref:dUTP diphosphatase n=1 Tax=Phytohalomonas tamaricis TaxID=2081032 RepID=UPI000D0AFAB9|nr:dUTP diphosphatase [Phytohalomonas tamaricis]